MSNFVVVGCAEEHRYEVADRVDLRNVEAWIGQFDEDAPEPDQIRAELNEPFASITQPG